MRSTSDSSTGRFSDRVKNYVRYRPGYPAEVLEILSRDAGLTPAAAIADIGSGTGISTALFLNFGNTVWAVEPNAEMRAAAEARLAGNERFHSVVGTAEATTLADASVDYVVAGQAFHWFDVPAARREFRRILQPRGWAVLMWNTRRTDSTPFLRDYEALLRTHGTDYAKVRHENIDAASLRSFHGGPFERRVMENVQQFNFNGIRGRLLSSSYVPAEDGPRSGVMLDNLREIFDRHQSDGRVRFEYDTEIYFGRPA